MAGRIKDEDVAAVKEKVHLDELVGDHVALRRAGSGSLKGLCPFHDEKSPSFQVRPAVGLWHCFGCDEGGDAIAFVMKIDHLGFSDAVERLAARVGLQLRYDETPGGRGGAPRQPVGQRQRLVDANAAAAQWYAEQLDDPRRVGGARSCSPSAASTGPRPSTSGSGSPRAAARSCCGTCAGAASPRRS